MFIPRDDKDSFPNEEDCASMEYDRFHLHLGKRSGKSRYVWTGRSDRLIGWINPIGSFVYFTYIWLMFTINVDKYISQSQGSFGKYTVHHLKLQDSEFNWGAPWFQYECSYWCSAQIAKQTCDNVSKFDCSWYLVGRPWGIPPKSCKQLNNLHFSGRAWACMENGVKLCKVFHERKFRTGSS